MKHLTRKLALGTAVAVLLTLAARPLAADRGGMGPMPSSGDDPTPSSIEGTVTSVNVPTVPGSGPIVTLLDGLIHIDGAGAKVRFADGRDGAVTDIQAGNRIVALLKPPTAGAMLKADAFVVLSDTKTATLTGTLEAVDAQAKTLKLLDLTIQVTSTTSFGGPHEGTGVTGLADLHVGDLVSVLADNASSVLTATRVMLLAPVPMPMERLHGTVKSIGTTSWVITAGGVDNTVGVDSGTRIVGDPKVGDEVDVLARKDAAGNLTAQLIMKKPAPPPAADEHFQGTVKSISATSWVVTVDTTDKTVGVDSNTRINGDPKVGDRVEVLAKKDSAGALTAILIAKLPPMPPTPPERLHGTVKSIGATSWVITSNGTDKTVNVNAQTQIVGNPAVGDEVDVLASKDAAGVLTALLIAKTGSSGGGSGGGGGSNQASFDGTINAIAGPIFTVDTTKVLVTPMTELKGFAGGPKVGDKVHVDGMRLPDGSVMAKKIEKK